MNIGDKLYHVSSFDGELKVATVTDVYSSKSFAIVGEHDIKMFLSWYDVNSKVESSWSTSERRARLLHKFYSSQAQLDILRADMDKAIDEIDDLDYKEVGDE